MDNHWLQLGNTRFDIEASQFSFSFFPLCSYFLIVFYQLFLFLAGGQKGVFPFHVLSLSMLMFSKRSNYDKILIIF